MIMIGAMIAALAAAPAIAYEGEVGGVGYRIEFSLAWVNLKNEKFVKDPSTGMTMFGGRIAWGTSGDTPSRRVSSITVSIDDSGGSRRWNLPAKLVTDCFEPSVGRTTHNKTRPAEVASVERWLDPASRDLFFSFQGSDGGGTYSALYKVGFDGKVDRTIFQNGTHAVQHLTGTCLRAPRNLTVRGRPIAI